MFVGTVKGLALTPCRLSASIRVPRASLASSTSCKHALPAFQTVDSMRSHVAMVQAKSWASTGGATTVGLVPTMGALHQGHLDLIAAARATCKHVVASVFVNPTQFGPNDDFGSYPRDLARDADLLSQHNADALFAPTPETMYPSQPAPATTYVDVDGIDKLTEGSARPGHFRGVATVCSKLFNIVRPSHAFFGQKDALQCIVIRRLVRDLNFPLEVVIVPTRREVDGLAMSSRNVYLTKEERKAAPTLYRSLQQAVAAFEQGQRDVSRLRRSVVDALELGIVQAPDYVSLADYNTGQELPDDLLPADWPNVVVLSIAARVGKPRLLDNVLLISDRQADDAKGLP